jgi:hypothetical protein
MAARQSAFEHLGSSRTMGSKLIRRGVNGLVVCERMISMLFNTVISSRQQLRSRFRALPRFLAAMNYSTPPSAVDYYFQLILAHFSH